MPSRKSFNRDVPLDLTCTQCSHQFSKTLRELESEQEVPCPACGVIFLTTEFKAGLQAAEKRIDKFGRKISRHKK